MEINNLVTHYVTFRRTLGERCKSIETILRAFCRAVGPETRLNRIRLKAVTEFLAGKGPLTRTWHSKHSALKGIFEFAVSRGHLKKPPLPRDVPKRPPTLTPYIYSRDELRRLLDAIPACQPSVSRMETPTLRAIVLLLYGAGLRSSEVLKLSVADVDLPNTVLTVRRTKFYKSRLVPIGRDLTQALTKYAVGGRRNIRRPTLTALSSWADTERRFTAALLTMRSSGLGNTLGSGALTAAGSSRGCMTFGTPSPSIA